MPTPGERRALIFLASVAALGVGARGWKEWHSNAGPGLPGDRAALARQIVAVDSAIAAGGDRQRGSRTTRGKRVAAEAGKGDPPAVSGRRGPAPSEDSPAPERDARAMYRQRRQHHDSIAAPPARSPARVDLDIAAVGQIEALPWIGRALATQIVADRQAHGPFGSLTGLERVPGIGPATAARLQPYVTFSLPSRLGSTVESWPRSRHRRRPGT
jgi:DNA uptake protein ComE-like DNA-binding protein